MTQIERRQTRIRRIRAQLQKAEAKEKVVAAADTHHAIGVSQNFSENIPLFLQKHAGDPAIKVKKAIY
jgi:hypothetical protein